jgi:hypothetical protein
VSPPTSLDDCCWEGSRHADGCCCASGLVFCQSCCYEKFRLPHIDDKKLVRVCINCYRELSSTRRYGAAQAPPSSST